MSGNTTDVARASTKKSSNGMMRRLRGNGVAAGGRRREGWGIAMVLHLLALAGNGSRRLARASPSRKRVAGDSDAFAPCGTAAITQNQTKYS